MMSKVANAYELRALLERPSGFLSKLMLQALFRPLMNVPGALQRIETYPAEGLRYVSAAKFAAKGPYYRYVGDRATGDVIRLVEAWLRTAIARRERWLLDVDGNGRFVRLRGLKTVQQVLELAAADAERLREGERRRETAGECHVRPVLVLRDRKMWVELVSEHAFRLEGMRMRHCLGNGKYWRQFALGEARYFSLRDAQGRPRVTVEVCADRVTQARGTANSRPRPRWSLQIEALCAELGVRDEPAWRLPRHEVTALGQGLWRPHALRQIEIRCGNDVAALARPRG